MTNSERHQRLNNVQLDEKTLVRRKPEVEHERAIAIYDLLEENYFCPVGEFRGPYSLHISLADNRLILDIRDEDDIGQLTEVTLPVSPFRSVVKDYFLICESYYKAMQSANLGQVEAIDIGRRALHDEAAALLIERLADRVEIDNDTARRLFTLICVLHLKASAHGLGPHRAP